MNKTLYLLNNINYVYKKRIDGRLEPSIQYKSTAAQEKPHIYSTLFIDIFKYYLKKRYDKYKKII